MPNEEVLCELASRIIEARKQKQDWTDELNNAQTELRTLLAESFIEIVLIVSGKPYLLKHCDNVYSLVPITIVGKHPSLQK